MIEHEPMTPPEIREVGDAIRLVEFYVALSEVRPEIQLMALVEMWLKEQPPLTIHGLQTHYQPPTDEDEPAVLVGLLFIGAPIDMG